MAETKRGRTWNRSLALTVLLAVLCSKDAKGQLLCVLVGQFGGKRRVEALGSFKMISSVNVRLRSDC